jgi:hypothetical protein
MEIVHKVGDVRRLRQCNIRRSVGRPGGTGGSRAVVLAVAWLCLLVACDKPKTESVSTAPQSGDGIDVAPVQKAFQSADARLKFTVDDLIRMTQAKAYLDARDQIVRLLHSSGLTPEQKHALKDLGAKIEAQRGGIPK